ncbi:MAG: N-acetylmuramoyl-L-alanine amidase [Geminocystis sp.]|nr:N-acetylmuramoyl-L-alanine amidase [Geminocystis sp.]
MAVMKKPTVWTKVIIATGMVIGIEMALKAVPVNAQSLKVVYPPTNHETTAASIFIIGSAPAKGDVIVNGNIVRRSPQGNFAPSIPLKVGKNEVVIRYGREEVKRTILRKDNQPLWEEVETLSSNLINPREDVTVLPGENVCFSAITPIDAKTTVTVGGKKIPLTPDLKQPLPPNSAVLLGENQTLTNPSHSWQRVTGCASFDYTTDSLTPVFSMNYKNKNIERRGNGKINVLNPQRLPVVEVKSIQGVTRTGPGVEYSRLTPLPQGVKARVTGKRGEWLRLDYGGWIRAEETKILPTNTPPVSFIRSITSRLTENSLEIVFPLEVQVPISILQTTQTLTLTLYNTIAQTDIIRFDDNPLIEGLDWHQKTPTQVEYLFTFKSPQQWGYDVYYQGSNLILSLSLPPRLKAQISGATIVIDPGHGGEELGALGPTGVAEKDVNLRVALLLAQQLKRKGATVYLTRETDEFVALQDRQNIIRKIKPTIALSIHYNALPDGGDAETTKGISTYWYHPQARDLAVYLHNYITEKLNRPSYGIYWNNLALTRPHVAPTVLLELGFMINPEEFEWITNPQAQEILATTLADAIENWLLEKTATSGN